jgi:transposase
VPAERVAAWRHELGARVTLVLGWAEVYRVARDEAKRTRARDKLEAIAAALRAFLLTPP